MSDLLDVRDLRIFVQTNKQPLVAVSEVSFQLQRGETLVLLGESGCGKSLTSYALMRLLPPGSAYGVNSVITFEDLSLLELPEYVMRGLRGRRMAMIFQEPMTALNPVLTIEQQLAEALRHEDSHLRGQALRARMIALLQEVDIDHPEMRLGDYPHQLSGGQKQRIVIAMALAQSPDVLIADEPTTALDVTIQAQILQLLKKLQQQRGMSIVFITHDLHVVKTIAHRVCVMYAGQLIEAASVSDFFTVPKHPYSQGMFLSLPTIAHRGKMLRVIPGTVPALDAMPPGCRFHPRCPYRFEPCDKIEPLLQTLSDGRAIRCHLYPTVHSLPEVVPDLIQPTLKEDTSAETVLLSVNHLKVYFKKSAGPFRHANVFKAVDDVSFQLSKGKTLALVGESGCGKTTTARAILGLQAITAGDILYRGRSLQQLRGKAQIAFRKQVQIVFQDPYASMNPRMTIGDILAEGLVAQRISKAKIIEKQYRLLDQVRLPKTSLSRYPHQFSGGQRQRICIARALALEPELLICDEPTSALDVSVQAQILNLLKELQQEYGLAYLFITHNMGVVSYIADEVMVMQHGRVVETGTCEHLLTSAREAYTKQLLRV